MKYNTYTGDSIQQHKIWPTASMLINKVSDDAWQWNGHDVAISIGGIFFFIERFVCSINQSINFI